MHRTGRLRCRRERRAAGHLAGGGAAGASRRGAASAFGGSLHSRAARAVALLAALAAQAASGARHGDPAEGRTIFEGKGGCLACHAVGNRGGAAGPDLSEVGVLRTPESLRLAITDPDAEIQTDHLTITVVTRQGKRVRGLRLNEDDISIQLRDVEGNLRSFLKDDLKDLRRELRSLMPSYKSKLSAAEIDQLVAYLCTLKGVRVEAGEPARRRRDIPSPSERTDWLTRPDRDATERPEQVLDALQIPPGAVVADVGAGAGYYTWRLARRVGPSGKVFAVEIQRRMLDLVAQEVKKRDLDNVELVLGDERDPRLPEGALDLVLIANAYHEFSEPEAMMASIRRSLKPDGRVAVVEYRLEDAYTPVPGLHKMYWRELRAEIEPLGFQLEQVLDFLPLQHLLIFSKRP